MARKRLSDLLREEVGKPADTETTEMDQTASSVQSSQPRRSARKTSQSRSQSPVSDQKSESDQNTLIAELKTALTQVEGRENNLKQEVSALKGELKECKAQIKTLQAKQKRAANLEKELEQAKITLLQLAEVNTNLQQALEAYQNPAESSPLPLVKLAPTTATLPDATNDPIAARKEIIRQRQQAALAHPVFPDKPPSGSLNDQDLGWVD